MKLADEIERLRKSSRSNDFIEFIADHGEELIRILRASDDVGRMRAMLLRVRNELMILNDLDSDDLLDDASWQKSQAMIDEIWSALNPTAREVDAALSPKDSR